MTDGELAAIRVHLGALLTEVDRLRALIPPTSICDGCGHRTVIVACAAHYDGCPNPMSYTMI